MARDRSAANATLKTLLSPCKRIEKAAAKAKQAPDGRKPPRMDWIVGVTLDTSGAIDEGRTHADVARSRNKDLERRLGGRTLVVRNSWGGLAPPGLLDDETPTFDAHHAAVAEADRDLVLQLIASHHGRARPVIRFARGDRAPQRAPAAPRPARQAHLPLRHHPTSRRRRPPSGRSPLLGTPDHGEHRPSACPSYRAPTELP